ncbi:hypothetical protein, partial [Streptomyces sp.]|uniref:hypothetical protein n=1 Tax=Streptomyces sp. TaxID=1931 RepID=UPI002F3E4062
PPSPLVKAQAALDRAHTLRALGAAAQAAAAAHQARALYAEKGHRPGIRWCDTLAALPPTDAVSQPPRRDDPHAQH